MYQNCLCLLSAFEVWKNWLILTKFCIYVYWKHIQYRNFLFLQPAVTTWWNLRFIKEQWHSWRFLKYCMVIYVQSTCNVLNMCLRSLWNVRQLHSGNMISIFIYPQPINCSNWTCDIWYRLRIQTSQCGLSDIFLLS